MANHLTPTELARESGLERRDVIAKCMELGVPIFLTQVRHTGTPWAEPASFSAMVNAISEFAVPTASASPEGITAGPDGNLWFVEQLADKIGMINPGEGMMGVLGLAAILLLGVPLAVNEWLRSILMRHIDRARTRQ